MEFLKLFSPFVYLYVGGEVCKGFADKASLMPFRHSETHDIIQCVRVFGDVMVKVANKYTALIIASVGAVFVLSGIGIACIYVSCELGPMVYNKAKKIDFKGLLNFFKFTKSV